MTAVDVPLLAELARDGDVPARDLLRDPVELLAVLLRNLRADRPEADALLREAERDVATTLPRPVLHALDHAEDAFVDLLLRARQHVRTEERLVRVDADPPHVLLARGVERAEPAAAGDLEHDLRALLDLVQRELLALRLVVPVL